MSKSIVYDYNSDELTVQTEDSGVIIQVNEGASPSCVLKAMFALAAIISPAEVTYSDSMGEYTYNFEAHQWTFKVYESTEVNPEGGEEAIMNGFFMLYNRR